MTEGTEGTEGAEGTEEMQFNPTAVEAYLAKLPPRRRLIAAEVIRQTRIVSFAEFRRMFDLLREMIRWRLASTEFCVLSQPTELRKSEHMILDAIRPDLESLPGYRGVLCDEDTVVDGPTGPLKTIILVDDCVYSGYHVWRRARRYTRHHLIIFSVFAGCRRDVELSSPDQFALFTKQDVGDDTTCCREFDSYELYAICKMRPLFLRSEHELLELFAKEMLDDEQRCREFVQIIRTWYATGYFPPESEDGLNLYVRTWYVIAEISHLTLPLVFEHRVPGKCSAPAHIYAGFVDDEGLHDKSVYYADEVSVRTPKTSLLTKWQNRALLERLRE